MTHGSDLLTHRSATRRELAKANDTTQPVVLAIRQESTPCVRGSDTMSSSSVKFLAICYLRVQEPIEAPAKGLPLPLEGSACHRL